MAYFPFFIDLTGKKCLIVGGGRVAARKAEKLAGFCEDLTVVAPKVCDEMPREHIKIRQRSFQDSDLDGVFLVIAATDDSALNHHIFTECTTRGILANTVDDLENCGFIFPALVKKNNITVGISTGGDCPAMAGFLRKMIDEQIDEHLLSCADILRRFRPDIQRMFSAGAPRRQVTLALLEYCSADERIPDDAQIRQFLEEWKEHEDSDCNTEKSACAGTDCDGHFCNP